MNFTNIIESFELIDKTIVLRIKFRLQTLIEMKLLESDQFYKEFDTYIKSITNNAPIKHITLLNV